MKLLPSAFNAGGEDWAEAIAGLSAIDLGQSLLGPVTYKGMLFELIAFNGSTVRNSYFDRCTFRDCTFDDSAFEQVAFSKVAFDKCSGTTVVFTGCSFSDVTFDACSVDKLALEGTTDAEISVTNSVMERMVANNVGTLDLGVKLTRVRQILVDSSMSMSLRLESVQDVAIHLAQATGSLYLVDGGIKELSAEKWSSGIVSLKRSEVTFGVFADCRDKIEVRSIDAYLTDVNLNVVDLVKSTFISSALINCAWPAQEGKTDWFGKFHAPSNLLAQPVNDVSGLPATIRSQVERSQRLTLLELESRHSFVQLVLHRLIGATTGHGRDPSRLVIFAAVLALMLAVGNQSPHTISAAGQSLSGARHFGSSVFLDWTRFLEVMALVNNKTNDHLVVGLSVAASAIGLVLTGLLVTVLANYLFRDK